MDVSGTDVFTNLPSEYALTTKLDGDRHIRQDNTLQFLMAAASAKTPKMLHLCIITNSIIFRKRARSVMSIPLIARSSFCTYHGRTTFHGHVTTESGSPVSGASITLYRWANGNGSGESVDNTTTDADGVFQFRPKSGGTAYSVGVKKVGYGNRDSGQVQANPSGDVAFSVCLIRADSFIGGTVIDRYGHVIAGADVRSKDVDNLHTTTDAEGHFRLDGVPEGSCSIDAEAPEGRHGGYTVQSGRDNVIVYVFSSTDLAASNAQMKVNQAADPHLHGNGKDAAVLLRDAESQATATGKAVFLVFGASWCSPCYRLSRLLEHPEFKSVMDAHFVVLDLDILEENKKNRKGWENPGGVDIYKKYGGVGSIPFWVFLDPAGHNLGDSIIAGQNEGLSSDGQTGEHFLQVVKVIAPSISVREAETLRQLFQHMTDD